MITRCCCTVMLSRYQMCSTPSKMPVHYFCYTCPCNIKKKKKNVKCLFSNITSVTCGEVVIGHLFVVST